MPDKVIEIKRQHGVATVRMMSGDVLKVLSALYLERKLHVNQPLDPEEYRLFMMQRGYPHALEAAMKFLALRERSEQEIVSRLRRSRFDEATIQKVVETLNLHELVSDERFAEQWVHSRSRKYGKNRIVQELRRKGVSGEEAQAALDAVPEDIRKLAPLLRAVLSDGVKCVIGNEAQIRAAADAFTEVNPLFTS